MKRKDSPNQICTPTKKHKPMNVISPLKSGIFSEATLKQTKLPGIATKYTIDISNMHSNDISSITLEGYTEILAKKADTAAFHMEIIGGKIYRAILQHLEIEYLSSSKILKLTSQTGENWVGVALEQDYIDLYKHYLESNYSPNSEDKISLNRASAGYYYDLLPKHLKQTVTLISLIRWLCCDDDMHPGNIMVNGDKILMIDSGRVGRLKYTSTADSFNALMWTFMFHQKTSFSPDVKAHFLDAARILLENREELCILIDNAIIGASPSNDITEHSIEIRRLSIAINRLPKYPFNACTEIVTQNSISQLLSETIKANFEHLRQIYKQMLLPSNLAIEKANRIHNLALTTFCTNQIISNVKENEANTVATVCL